MILFKRIAILHVGYFTAGYRYFIKHMHN